MSTTTIYVLPSDVSWSPLLERQLVAYIRMPEGLQTDPDGVVTALEFSPALDAQQEADLTLIGWGAGRGIEQAPAELAQLQDPLLPALATYLQNASPTAAQTAAATKNVIRVLRILLRE